MKADPLRVMTYNLGGGRRDFGTDFRLVHSVIEQARPDILALQEATTWQDSQGAWHDTFTHLAGDGGAFFFGATISLKEHFHPGKPNFIRAMYEGHQDWQLGNALVVRERFCGLQAPQEAGAPFSLPIYRPPQYLGNRDTDPRGAILARIALPGVSPVVLVTHLSTLIGERDASHIAQAEIAEKAESLRCAQMDAILAILAPAMRQDYPILLMGDLNAAPGECCLGMLIHAGFVRLAPRVEIPTHLRMPLPVDHILFYPAHRLAGYTCQIIDTPEARAASDHLPVLAELSIIRSNLDG